jgi:hypothetical protein
VTRGCLRCLPSLPSGLSAAHAVDPSVVPLFVQDSADLPAQALLAGPDVRQVKHSHGRLRIDRGQVPAHPAGGGGMGTAGWPPRRLCILEPVESAARRSSSHHRSCRIQHFRMSQCEAAE